MYQLYLGGLCCLGFFHARTDSSVVLYGITCKQWEEVVGHTLTEEAEFGRKLHPEPHGQSLLADAGGALPEAHSLWLHRRSLQHVVCSYCSRTQASCSLVLLLGDVTPPPFSAITIQEGYFNKIPMSQDSAYRVRLLCWGPEPVPPLVSFLLTSRISSITETCRGLGFFLVTPHVADNAGCIVQPQLQPLFLCVAAQQNVPGWSGRVEKFSTSHVLKLFSAGAGKLN